MALLPSLTLLTPACRVLALLRDMSYEELPASDTYHLLPDVCDATGGGGNGASEEGRAGLRVRSAQVSPDWRSDRWSVRSRQ